ncbi:MAG: nitrile hydratase subunit beta [Pseudomonadales bacterium]
MDGIHDLGGRQGHGAVDVGAGAAIDAVWEARVFALVQVAFRAGFIRNTDQFRHAVERIDPAAYLTQGYFGRWTGGLETLLVEAGVLDSAAIDSRARALGLPDNARIAARPRLQPDRIPHPPTTFHNARSLATQPRFASGDAVVTCCHGTSTHTRLPGYARGRHGRVVACHGGWVFPDSNAHGHGEDPQYLYTVAFSAQTLWGEEADPMLSVRLDLFEPYLEATGDTDG